MERVLFRFPLGYKNTTSYLVNKILENSESLDMDFSKILWLFPTLYKLKNSKELFDGIMHSRGINAFFPPCFHTLNSFVIELIEKYSEKQLLSFPQLFFIFNYLILNEKEITSHFFNSREFYGISPFIHKLLELYRELRFYVPEIPISQIREKVEEQIELYYLVEKRVNPVFSIFEKFEEIVKQNELVPEPLAFLEAQELVPKISFAFDTLVLDSFFDFTPQEKNLLNFLFKKIKRNFVLLYDDDIEEVKTFSENVYNFLKKNGEWEEIEFKRKRNLKNFEDVPLHNFPSMEDEIEGIAKKILYLFYNNSAEPKDISIVFPGTGKYADLIDRIFPKYSIPYSANFKRSLSCYAACHSILLFLECLIKNFAYRSFLAFLTSPYFSKIKEEFRDLFPFFAEKAGIIEGKEYWERFIEIFNRRKDKEDAEENYKDALDTIEEVLSFIFKTIGDLDPFEKKTIYEWIYWLIDKLKKFGWMEEFEETELFELKENVYNVFHSILILEENFPEIYINLSQIKAFLEGVFQNIEVSLSKERNNSVQILDLFETQGIQSKFLFFAGAVEGDFPRIEESPFFFPESIKEILGMTTRRKIIQRDRYYKSNILESYDNIFITYPLEENERIFLPSPFIYNTQRCINGFPELNYFIFSHEEKEIEMGKKQGIYLEDFFIEPDFRKSKDIQKILKGQFGTEYNFWVTKLEKFAKCPYRFYLEEIFSFALPKEPSVVLEQKERGTVIHNVLKRSFKYLIEQKLPKTDELLKKVLRYSLIEELKNLPYAYAIKNFIKEEISGLFPVILLKEKELKEKKFVPYKVEEKISTKLERGTKLVGRIDRIDKNIEEDKVYLIDYKTGSANIRKITNKNLSSAQEIKERFWALQLPLYTYIWRQNKEVKKIEALFYTFSNSSLDRSKYNFYTLDEDALILEKNIIELTKEYIREIRNGFFSASPWKETECRSCSFKPCCPKWLKRER